tara:strand:- start:1344 stop:2135 length:792 start_codon:yes stop_codon:yes gene_type:complete
MVDEFVTGICVASEEFVAHLRTAGFKKPIYVTGLPFGKEEVQSRIPDPEPLHQRTKRVGFAARWDDEKQPHFFMDLAEAYYKIDPSVEFAIFCGHPELKSSDPEYVERAQSLALRERNDGWPGARANFKIYTGLKKNEYYELLADSQVLFNCALQDWVSNTVSEADSFGTLTLYPAYRSFPEVFANNGNHMYVPWSLDDAIEKLTKMFDNIAFDDLSCYNLGKISDYQNGTIERTLKVLAGMGLEQQRDRQWYRRKVSEAKYD